VSQIVARLMRVFLLPVRLLRLVGRAMATVVQPLLSRVDSSGSLSSLIDSLSSSMASQRGLPLIVGTGILVLSLVTHAIVLVALVSTDAYDRNLYWLCIPFSLLHIGVLAGFTGAMLATPLGQSYRDK
jgi:hypothetical protein